MTAVAIRLIAIDIDGTLLDSRWQLPEPNRKAVVEAVARGVEVALVTGRRFDFARPIAELFCCPLTLIVNNGALIKSLDGATEFRRLLPRGVARAILAATPEFRDGAAVVFDRARENQVIFERINWGDPERSGYFQRNREFIAQVTPLESCLTEDPIQVMFSGRVAPMRECAALLQQMAEQKAIEGSSSEVRPSNVEHRDSVHTARGGARFALAVTEYAERDFSLVDAIRADCSKGAALAEWARRRGLAREEVMALGDNWNDLEMLEFAGLPVVMGNSVSRLKESGWQITLTNDQAGVAAAIEEHVLGPGKANR
jgi:hydroxymethylpyrimidine pyrophosphatase-like HAD family hydrolase